MKNTKIRMIVDVAMNAALSTLFFVIMIYIPFLSPIMMFLFAMLMMFVSCKHGFIASVFVYILSVVGWYAMNSDIDMVLRMSVFYLLPGIAFGISAKRNQSFMFTVAVTSAMIFLGTMTDILFINGDGDGIREMLAQITSSVEPVLMQVAEMNNLPESIDIAKMIEQFSDILTESIILWLPSAVIVSSVVYGYLVSALGIFFLKRINVKKIEYVKFSDMKATNGMCSIFAILYLITMFSESMSIYMSAARNMMLILGFGIAICGFSFIDWLIAKKIKSGYIRAIIYAVVCFVGFMLMPMLISALLFAGFLDRTLRIRPERIAGEDKNEDKQKQ